MTTPLVEQAVSFFINRSSLIKMIDDQRNIDSDLLHVSAIFRTSGEVKIIVQAVKDDSALGKGFPAFFQQGNA